MSVIVEIERIETRIRSKAKRRLYRLEKSRHQGIAGRPRYYLMSDFNLVVDMVDDDEDPVVGLRRFESTIEKVAIPR